MTESKVLEKIKYEQKLKRQYVWRCAITAILLVMLNLLYVFNMGHIANWLEIWWLSVDYFFWGVMVGGSLIVFGLLSVRFKEQYDDKLDEFNSKSEEEKFV